MIGLSKGTLTYNQACIIMSNARDNGFDSYFEGCGDGSYRLIIEDPKFTVLPLNKMQGGKNGYI